jgi:molybdopterin converting factor small subunit
MEKYRYNKDGEKDSRKNSIFVTEKNIHRISFIDPEVKTLVEVMEKKKPEIFEEELETNNKTKVLNEIDANRLVRSDEVLKKGSKKYKLTDLKRFANNLNINIQNKNSDFLIDEIRKVIYGEDNEEE